MKINVVDSVMGSGKTYFAFEKMYNDVGQKYIFVTPYLEQIYRLLLAGKVQELPEQEKADLLFRYHKDFDASLYSKWYLERNFRTPINFGEGKLSAFHGLLIEGKNIATTHKLFTMFTQETVDLIKGNGYKLIVDEDLSTTEMYEVYSKDYHMLKNDGIIVEGDNNTIQWQDGEYDGRFNDLKIFCGNGIITKIKDTQKYEILIWRLDHTFFECFEEMWVLTYIFKSNMLYYYLQLNGLEYDLYTLDHYKLISAKEEDVAKGEKFRHLINIYDGKLNNVGEKRTALSLNWYKKNGDLRKLVGNNVYNYFKNIIQTNQDDFLWTVFKSQKENLWRNGYKGSFIALNTKATNKYRHKKVLAYCCNRFESPIRKTYFRLFEVEIDDNYRALGEMIQWIWRSQIREGRRIDVYIPSVRMRELLQGWLNGEQIHDGGGNLYG